MRTHSKSFHIRFTEDENERLRKYAKQTNLPKSTYIRFLLPEKVDRENILEQGKLQIEKD